MADVHEALVLFQEAVDREDDPEESRALFERVLAIQRELGGVLETDDVLIPLEATLMNIAALSQRLRDWPRLRDVAAELRAVTPFQGAAHTMYSIALKHLGDPLGAAKALESAFAVAPSEVNPRYEQACQLLARGDRAGALDAIAAAMERGAEPDALREDDELASLRGDPRFEVLLGRDHHVACLVQLLDEDHADFAESAPAPDEDTFGDWITDDETIERFEDAVDLVSQLLEAANVTSVPLLPADAGGDEILDFAQCDPTQVRAIEAVLRAERFWHAIPFLLVLGHHHLPSLNPEDARDRLGVP
ncbi:MAG: tetratricopeptide repeat protein [Kofleriaceae bacterium]